MIKKILFIIFVLISLEGLSQQKVTIHPKEFKIKGKSGTSKAMKNIKYGDFYYDQLSQGDFRRALKYYIQAQQYNPDNAELNYKIGVCFSETAMAFKALTYLKKAYSLKKNVASDILYYLAYAYQANYKFDSAIVYYNLYKENLKENSSQKQIVNKRIEECQNGKSLLLDSVNVRIDNLSQLNSSYQEYATTLTADGKILYFTSRRPNITGGIDVKDDLPYEDIYMSKKQNGIWGSPVNLTALNTPGHDDVVGISQDGNTLILFRNGDLYFSIKDGDNWTKPEAFPSVINSNEIESSATFSPDGQTLYFVRGKSFDKQLSNGDIYFSKKDEKGKWTKPVRLPDNVNSPYDEDGLFMMADGKTLYFSSKGHNSMGGYDIFKTEIQKDGTFSDPVNLGYPINSPNDDIYFVKSPSKLVAYFTSIRPDTKGSTDIYQVNLYGENLFMNTENNLIAAISEPKAELNLEGAVMVVISGKIVDKKTGKPIDAEIIVVDNKTNKVVYRTKANSKTGKYTITLPSGKNYGVTLNKDGYLFHSENFDLSTTSNYKEITKNIEIQTQQVNTSVILKNVFFEFGSSTIQQYSIPELNNVVQYMKNNPNISVEIAGHTDNIGSYEQNMKLSQQRADAVAKYLISKGIDKTRLTTKGYGYTKPLYPNDTPEHRQENRRVEFIIKKM